MRKFTKTQVVTFLKLNEKYWIVAVIEWAIVLGALALSLFFWEASVKFGP